MAIVNLVGENEPEPQINYDLVGLVVDYSNEKGLAGDCYGTLFEMFPSKNRSFDKSSEGSYCKK